MMYPPYFYVSIKLDTTASGACTFYYSLVCNEVVCRRSAVLQLASATCRAQKEGPVRDTQGRAPGQRTTLTSSSFLPAELPLAPLDFIPFTEY